MSGEVAATWTHSGLDINGNPETLASFTLAVDHLRRGGRTRYMSILAQLPTKTLLQDSHQTIETQNPTSSAGPMLAMPPKISSHLFIVGAPCSGTNAMYAFLQGCECKAFFENLHEDCPPGIYVDWKAPRVWDKYPDAMVIQLVRDPIAMINSFSQLKNNHVVLAIAGEQVKGLCDIKQPFDRIAIFWIGWNELIETRARSRIRVEDINPPRVNRHAIKDLITWENMRQNLSNPVANAIESKSKEYGYPIGGDL